MEVEEQEVDSVLSCAHFPTLLGVDRGPAFPLNRQSASHYGFVYKNNNTSRPMSLTAVMKYPTRVKGHSRRLPVCKHDSKTLDADV
ncbi:hypothetical protein EYF80_006388 [Liparis tanakae]|uniref:Uncharacterized protein n=1 Tax=Liparis tanakae TaxID=230148 RepID=A0A4Z2J065_9TELE|nr:hypothetical protein EYF80_006388 [Liparis tanakae]